MEYISLIKKVTIAPAATETVALESGIPYMNYTAWVHAINPTLSVQPLFAGLNDGAPVVMAASAMTKVKQSAAGELRPQTTGRIDAWVAKSAIAITNNGASAITVDVYMLASPASW